MDKIAAKHSTYGPPTAIQNHKAHQPDMPGKAQGRENIGETNVGQGPTGEGSMAEAGELQNPESGGQKIKKEINMSPFIVKSIATRGAAYRDLDKISAHGLEGYEQAAKRAEEYALYFREHDINTEWYCRKVALLTELADEENEGGQKIKGAIKSLLKKHWADAYGYIEKAPGPLSFDKFHATASKIRQMAASTKKNKNVFEFSLSKEKAELAEKLWQGLEEKFGGRVPATLEQYFSSEVNKKDEKNSFLFGSTPNIVEMV
jgi:hypothetical protein